MKDVQDFALYCVPCEMDVIAGLSNQARVALYAPAFVLPIGEIELVSLKLEEARYSRMIAHVSIIAGKGIMIKPSWRRRPFLFLPCPCQTSAVVQQPARSVRPDKSCLPCWLFPFGAPRRSALTLSGHSRNGPAPNERTSS